MKKIKWVVFLIILSNSLTIFGQLNKDNAVIINNISQAELIGENITYFEDFDGKLTIDDIQKNGIQEKFLRGTTSIFAHPATSSAFWFKFSIINQCDEDLWLEIGSTYAWYIDFYKEVSPLNFEKIAETGTMRSENSKFYDYNEFWLPVNKANKVDTENYYLRIATSLPLELPLYVGTVKSLSKNRDINNYLTAGFVGLMLIMLLYNLFLYISTKDHVYIWYLGFLFLMMISMPYANSHPFIQDLDFLFFNKNWWNEYFIVWHSPAYFFVGMFCIKYLNLKEKLPLVYKLIVFEIVILAFVSPLLNIFGLEIVKIINFFQVVVLLLYLTCIITAYYLMFKGHIFARFYVLGWTFMIVHVFIFFATVNGYFPYSNFSRNALYFGVGLEVWMFSLALGDRINLIRKEKEDAQLKYVELVDKQNETLQLKVSERTAQLEETYEDIEVANAELSAQADQLAQINKTKDMLLSIIGHDLKSPISSLKVLLNLVLDKRMNAEEFKIMAQKFHVKLDNVLFLLGNLLQWANSQRDGIVVKPASLILYIAVEQNIQLLNFNTEEKKIKVLNYVPKDISVWSDISQVNIILLNLLSNALKYTPQNGTIVVDAQKLDNKLIQVSIADNGVGMNGETLQSVFDPFLHITNEGTEGESGTGLGLILCKDFVKKNGGEIWAVSEELKGSTFYFTLPIASN